MSKFRLLKSYQVLIKLFIFCIGKYVHEAAVNQDSRTMDPCTKLNNEIKKTDPTALEHQDFWVPLTHCNVGEVTK